MVETPYKKEGTSTLGQIQIKDTPVIRNMSVAMVIIMIEIDTLRLVNVRFNRD